MLNVKYEYICPVSGYSSFRTRFEKGIRLESETVSAAVTFVTLFKICHCSSEANGKAKQSEGSQNTCHNGLNEDFRLKSISISCRFLTAVRYFSEFSFAYLNRIWHVPGSLINF